MEREQATKFMYDLLRALVAKKGSDLFITANFPPAMKVDGRMTPSGEIFGMDAAAAGMTLYGRA